ncbi:hypothetical protein KC327_g20 [Hortaea werneckii]|nr:hypothetical protein KC327_g20 [Hortaea werneckii]
MPKHLVGPRFPLTGGAGLWQGILGLLDIGTLQLQQRFLGHVFLLLFRPPGSSAPSRLRRASSSRRHEFVREWVGVAVDRDVDSAGKADLESGCCHDHVGVQLLPVHELDAVGRDGVNHTSLDAALALSQRLVEVTIGAKAHSLLEGVVAGVEVRIA